MILTEMPVVRKALIFARRGGKYVRPIAPVMIDLSTEDARIDRIRDGRPFVGRLPDIGDQVDKYVYGATMPKVVDGSFARERMQELSLFELPHCEDCEHWEHFGRPWWEYAMATDKYGFAVKARLYPRPGEPNADDIDERLDQFPQNQGTLKVISPVSVEQIEAGHIKEGYLQKLDRVQVYSSAVRNMLRLV
jgi:hypothetical protein